MRAPRIALVIDGLGPGGAEKTVLDVAGAFAAMNLETVIVYLQNRSSSTLLEACGQRNIATVFSQISRLWKVHEWLSFLRAIRRIRPDVLHAHLHYATIVSVVVGALLRIPTFVTLHTLEEPGFWSKTGLRLRLMFALLNYLPCELICLTNRSKEAVLKYVPNKRDRIHIIPNGLSTSDWKVSERRFASHDPSRPMVLLSVAVLRRLKGLHHLVHAHAVLSRRFPNLHLHVVGDGPERDNLEREAERVGCGERVVFAGQRPDVREIMQSADMFVLPTLFDALPTVIIEAMATGLPIIASRTGGIPEMIQDGENGLLVEPSNEDELIQACERLIRSPQLAARLGAAARERAERNFDLNVQVQRLVSVYGLRGKIP